MALLCVMALYACAKSNYIYRSPNKLDYVKVSEAKEEEKNGGLSHPYPFKANEIEAILRSLQFGKKAFFSKQVKERELFEERHILLITPYLLEAFRKVSSEQVVTVSFFTQSRKLGLMDDRLTVFRAFVREDGLHLKFLKLYAKIAGDTTTKGEARAIGEAKGRRVSLEVQPGQTRISWEPEEIAFSISDKVPKEGLVAKSVSSGQRTGVKKPEAPLSIRERLKELGRLKDEELITEEEFEKKRKELLKEL